MTAQALLNEHIALRKRLEPQWEIPESELGAKVLQLQEAFGFRIPEQILRYIGLCAGIVYWDEPNSDKLEDESVSSPQVHESEDERFDYGYVSFFTLEGIVDEYEGRSALAPELQPPAVVVGPVRAEYFDKRWIPIASGVGGSRFALDMNPAKAGIKGQVIWIDDESSIVRVVASSLEDFLRYGCECLRYQLGEANVVPRPPFRPKSSGTNFEELHADPECARIASLWKQIGGLARILPAPSEFPVEFHKPNGLEQIQKLEKRFKTVFPKQLVCSLRTMGFALNMWLQTGTFESRPIAIGLAPEVVAWDKMFRKNLKDGITIPQDLPALSESLAYVLFASTGGLKESMSFYVVCSPEPHPLVGKVLLHYTSGSKDIVSLFADDIASFLGQGLARMQNDQNRLRPATGRA